MQQYNHFEYGEMLARKLKPISHTNQKQRYYRATELEELEELNDRLSSAEGIILIAIDGNNSDFGYNNSDNLMELPQYFFIVAKSAPSNDTDNIFTAQAECKSIGMQIIARMMQEGRNYNAPLQFLDPNKITIRGIGPIGDNFYGIIIGFNFNWGVNYTIDKTMWED